MTETLLYEQVASYLRLEYPTVRFHFDLSGMWTPSHKARNLYGRLNQRAWPDLFIAAPNHDWGSSGLFVELKREATRLKKKDGSWASEHIAEQAAVIDGLGDVGYIAQFAVGFEQAKSIIDSYLEAP